MNRMVADVDFSKPCLMGILNITPDSFSDGGNYLDPRKAIQHAEEMVAQGADIIDVGGESTRPGSERVSVAEQRHRVIDVIFAIRKAFPHIPISIDTTQSAVADAALAAGASILNDVSAGCEDSAMFRLAAENRAYLCLMHKQGSPMDMQDNPHYGDVVAEVEEFLLQRAEDAKKSGVDDNKILLDPGIGFGKTLQHNLELLANLQSLTRHAYPVLLGASRKRFIASLSRGESPEQREPAGLATTVYGYLSGVKVFRVHDVAAHRQVLLATSAIHVHRVPAWGDLL